MLKTILAAFIGVILSVTASMALVSSQGPEDLEAEGSVLSTYGER